MRFFFAVVALIAEGAHEIGDARQNLGFYDFALLQFLGEDGHGTDDFLDDVMFLFENFGGLFRIDDSSVNERQPTITSSRLAAIRQYSADRRSLGFETLFQVARIGC